MTTFERGDRVKVARRAGLPPAEAVVVGHDESERGEDGQVVLRIVVELEGGRRAVLAEDSPLVTRDLVDTVQTELITIASDERVVWRPGTDPTEIAGVLSQYLTGKPDLAEALAVATEKQLVEQQTDPTPERTLEILSNSADALLARLRQDSPVDRDVRASDLVNEPDCR
jgi:hypothetical protein